jgi:hypothetical protein
MVSDTSASTTHGTRVNFGHGLDDDYEWKGAGYG